MMAFFFALLGGLAGAIVGAAALPMAAYSIFQMLGASTKEGAFAMGVMMTFVPIGSVVGLVLGVWAVLRGRGPALASSTWYFGS